MRYLGIDWGTKYIGLAISDTEGKFSFPYDVIENRGPLYVEKKLCEIVNKEGITHIIIGLPYHLSGAESESAEMVRKFTEGLKKSNQLQGLSFEFIDERFTSSFAQKELKEFKKRKNKKIMTNKIAAQLILQDYLDSKNMRQKRDK